jgi:pimeloyl-ACP methyl ester carboxylesterase
LFQYFGMVVGKVSSLRDALTETLNDRDMDGREDPGESLVTGIERLTGRFERRARTSAFTAGELSLLATGRRLSVARRGADGTWRFLVDVVEPSMRALGLVATVASLALGSAPAAAHEGTACRNVTVPTAGGTAHVDGTVCAPGPLQRRTLLILVPGATYTRAYWDWPYPPQRYSFVRRATAAGYATLAIDRLGHGTSTKPATPAMTTQASAAALHDVVQAARAGALGAAAGKVVLVGHSYGSVVSIAEASTYHDVDALVDTGWLHMPQPLAIGAFLASYHPANEEPRFAADHLDAGYLTTRPGLRGSPLVGLYYPPGTDPAIVAVDERLKDTLNAMEIATLPAFDTNSASQSIAVPVLLVVGDHDAFFCAPTCTSHPGLSDQEAGLWGPSACLRTVVVPRTGHDINLHRNAPAAYTAIDRWLDRVVTADAATPSPGCAGLGG